jgi:TetR/AcrR family transcriptional regulator, transcriptional repressor for nem operon
MARHKEFDRDEALQKAMEVFWARGYNATSIQDLVEHMRINRQSIYDTFGDKHALYLESLDRYCQVESGKAIVLLEGSASIKKAVRKLFMGVVDGSLGAREQRGCFAGNAMSELAGRCKATADRTNSNMAVMEGALYRALLRGKKAGELKALSEPRAVARFLYSSLQGLVLMSKATQDRKTLEDVVKVTLSVLV